MRRAVRAGVGFRWRLPMRPGSVDDVALVLEDEGLVVAALANGGHRWRSCARGVARR